MNKMMKTLSKLFALLILSASIISAQTKPFDFAELEKTIVAELKTAKTPGAAFAVISGDKVVFSKGFGTTSAESGGKVEGKQMIAPFVVENLQKSQFFLPGEEKAFYGYGLLGYEDSGVKTVSHGGVSRGYGSTVFFAPEQKIAVIVLANSNGQTLPKSRRKAMEMFLPLKAETTSQNAQTVVNTTELKRYAGKFSHAPQVWEFFIKDAKLFLKQDGKEFELKKTGKDNFSFEQGEFLFVPNDKGEFEHIFMGLYAARRVSN